MNGGLYRGARRLDAELYYFDRGIVYVLFLELESKLTWRGDSLPEEEYENILYLLTCLPRYRRKLIYCI